MHGRPRLSVYGRALLVRRVLEEGWRPAQAAEALGVSRATAYKWLRRFGTEGCSGLNDRSCRPRNSPRAVSATVEAHLLALRRSDKLGPHRLSDRTGVPRSTCYAVLRRHGLHRLDWIDRPTGVVVRRYERDRPGELVHVDIKKLGRIPDGGGHRVLGRAERPRWGKAGVGYSFVHACVDDHSRMAYAEVLDDEKAATCAAFMRRAGGFFAEHGVQVERVLTDNGPGYRSHLFRRAVAELGAVPRLTRPYRPQTNGKVERFNRTLLEEWAYVRPYASDRERQDLLAEWLHRYNHHRSHTALGGRSPVQRVNNLPGRYT